MTVRSEEDGDFSYTLTPDDAASKTVVVQPAAVPVPLIREELAELFLGSRRLNRKARLHAATHKSDNPFVVIEGNLKPNELEILSSYRGEMALADYIQTSLAELQWLANRPRMKLVALIACHKGTAGKSTVALYVGSIIAYYCNRKGLVFPTTENTTNASHGSMTELDLSDAMRISEFIARVEAGEFKTFTSLWSNIPQTAAGLGIIAEDEKKNLGDKIPEKDSDEARKAKFTLEKYDASQEVILPQVEFELLDGSNDDIAHYSLILQAARDSTAMAFIGNYQEDKTMSLMGETFSTYFSDPYMVEDTTVNGRLTNGVTPGGPTPTDGRHCSTRYKVAHATLVANRVPEGMAIDFAKYTGNIDFVGTTHCVGNDEYIATKPARPVDIHAIDEITLLRYIRIAIDLYKQAAGVLGIDIRKLSSVRPATGTLYHPQKQPVDIAGRVIPRSKSNPPMRRLVSPSKVTPPTPLVIEAAPAPTPAPPDSSLSPAVLDSSPEPWPEPAVPQYEQSDEPAERGVPNITIDGRKPSSVHQ